MRCKNCGWQNPDGLSNCERCSSTLENFTSPNTDTIPLSDNHQPESTSPLRSTVREATFGGYQNGGPLQSPVSRQESNDESCICKNCGYSLSPSMNVCPQCGNPQRHQSTQPEIKQNTEKHCLKCGCILMSGTLFCPMCGQPCQSVKPQRNNRGTVNAWDSPQGGEFCSLRPIPWARENIEYNAISFSGNHIILNRANTDPNNQSITSNEQAVLTYDGKDWYIEDLSDQRSTMLRVSRKTKLQSGDIIALGNRLFEFKD